MNYFLKLNICALLIALSTTAFNCTKDKAITTTSEKAFFFNGVSFVGPSKAITEDAMGPLNEINCNAVTLMPFGFISAPSGKVRFNTEWQWWGEKEVGIEKCVQFAQNKGLNIMIKPQVWISSGGWSSSVFTGDYVMNDEAGWKELEDTYYDFIIAYAKLSEKLQVQSFCVGTEWKQFFKQRPAFWSALIDSCRAKFSGKLTYAGNWDSYSSFPHWSKLDYIGIDAYFPVSQNPTPSIDECIQGWDEHFKEIRDLSLNFDRPAIFTEYGYRNIDYCGKEPWFSGNDSTYNTQAQINAYEALFQKFWKENWFKGGFLWKWFDDHQSAGGINDNYFTPQNKPVIETIERYYSPTN